MLGGVGIMVIVVSLVILVKTAQTSTPIEFLPAEASAKAGSSGQALTIRIDVEGAVVMPGVYQLSIGSRVEDAIVAAGGLAADADSERIAASINRAAKVVDGGKLYIPKRGEPAGVVAGTSNTGETRSAMVSINFASQSELEALSGIGPATAQKIIDNRPYQTLEELVSKKAMGQSLFYKLKDQLTL